MNRKILQAVAIASALVYCGTAAAQDNPAPQDNAAPQNNARPQNNPPPQNNAAPENGANTPAPPPSPATPPGPAPTPATTGRSPGAQPVQVRGEQVGPSRRPPNRPMLIGGAALLGLSYVPSFIAGVQSTRDADHLLYLPVVGPWLDLGNRSCTPAEPCTNEGISAALLVLSGTAQLAGGVLMAASFFVPQRAERVTTTVGSNDGFHFQVSPARMGVDGWGLAAIGGF
jgi:hypothetical protein